MPPATTRTGITGRKTGAARNTGPFPMTTGFPLAAAVSILNGLTPCVQSAKDTIPASNPQVRNGCGCAAAQARRTSTRWLISLPWQLRWPPFCTALTPTVLPNSFGVPPDLPFPYLFQVRGLPRYGFCALEMPLNSFVSHLPVCGLLLLPVLLISLYYSSLPRIIQVRAYTDAK